MAYELYISNKMKKSFDSEDIEFPMEIYRIDTLGDVFRKMRDYSKSCINEEKVAKLAEWHEVTTIGTVIFKEMYKSLWDSYYLLTFSVYEVKE